VAQGALPVNRVNTGREQGVALIQADGLNQLRTPFGGNRGDGGDVYPGTSGNHDLGIMTVPAAVDWNLVPLDVRIDHIVMQPDGSVTFRYLHRAPSLIAAGSPLAQIRINGTPLTTYTEVLAPGDTVSVGADSTQVSFDGRSSARWLSWSDEGGRDHIVVARAGAPDTLRANFAIDNRLRVIIAGPGSVTSDRAGAVGSGTFLEMTAAAHLVPVPSPGAEFVGWRGDTTTTGVVDLSMGHPWDLTALFTDSVTIDAAAAARALLGGAALPTGAASYLDTIGNQNGGYDVGDYLAWLRRNGQHVPPVLDTPVVR